MFRIVPSVKARIITKYTSRPYETGLYDKLIVAVCVGIALYLFCLRVVQAGGKKREKGEMELSHSVRESRLLFS